MNEEICKWLMSADESSISAVFLECWGEYMVYLAAIASDIYDSCIADYYEWRPKVYDRHGDISGFNLYRANDIEADGLDAFIGVDESKLLPYSDRKKDIRDNVLTTVMDGIRGGGARKKRWKGWPEDWTTSYPNDFSQYSDWSSSQTTINGILGEFVENAIKDTKDYFWSLLTSRI